MNVQTDYGCVAAARRPNPCLAVKGCCAALLLLAASALLCPAEAQTGVVVECKAPHKVDLYGWHTGVGTPWHAADAAVYAWSVQVAAKYGAAYGDWAKAKKTSRPDTRNAALPGTPITAAGLSARPVGTARSSSTPALLC